MAAGALFLPCVCYAWFVSCAHVFATHQAGLPLYAVCGMYTKRGLYLEPVCPQHTKQTSLMQACIVLLSLCLAGIWEFLTPTKVYCVRLISSWGCDGYHHGGMLIWWHISCQLLYVLAATAAVCCVRVMCRCVL